MRRPLDIHDYQLAASLLGCEVAAIKAVAAIEAPRGGFLESGQPTILFERHWFSRLTNGKWDKAYPDISNPNPGGYKGGQAEHDRLARAVDLDRNAALQSASWGKFQIMGFNYRACHMLTIQEFINAIFRDEQSQLRLFASLLQTKGWDKYLRVLDFAKFARSYNGPNYRINDYDGKLSRYYNAIKSSIA